MAMALPNRPILACLVCVVFVQLLSMCYAQCETAGRFGENCQHQCNCKSQCNTTTGACLTQCNESFEGPTCQKENVALKKIATSTSTYNNRWTADKVVDGDTQQRVESNNCFHSAVGLSPNTWSVDLGAVFPMDNIAVYYRKDYTHRFVNAEILVANATGGEVLCATVTSIHGDSNAVFRYTCSTYGSKLIIRHEKPCGECILELCEAQVFVCTEGFKGKDCNESCSAGWYGRGCLSQCGNCSEGTACRDTDGICAQGCLPGWRGDQCKQVCPKGTYGQNCSHTCGNCLDGANCHHVTGSCPNGSCQPGYMGDKCNENCTEGSYGQNCSELCGQCREGDVCHHVNGSCPEGCVQGWKSDLCSECQTGWYGTDCTPCGKCFNDTACDVSNGSCPQAQCAPGYRKVTCSAECASGTYGQECAMPCPACERGVSCDHVTGECPQSGLSQEIHNAAVDSPRGAGNSSRYGAGQSSGPGREVGIGVGAVLGVVLLILVVSLAVVCSRRRRRQNRDRITESFSQDVESPDTAEMTTYNSEVAFVSGADNSNEILG